MFKFRRQVLKSLALALCVPALGQAQGNPAPIKIAMIEGLSGGNANGGEAVFRNLAWAVERVNDRGGVRLPGGARRLSLERYDSKGQIDEALSTFRSAVDDGAQFIVQGNSSAPDLCDGTPGLFMHNVVKNPLLFVHFQ